MAGHRGVPVRFPDNTFEGFAEARRLVGMAELDVRRSADGYKVLAHDPHIGGYDIATTDWPTLAEVELFDALGKGGYHPICLEDVLDGLPDLALDIEIKNHPGDPGFDPPSAFAVDVARCARPIDVVTSFNWPTMDVVKQRQPDVTTGLLIDRDGSVCDGLEHAVANGHEFIAPHWSLLDREDSLDFIRQADIRIATWTVNDEGLAISLSEAGVEAIITDDPERIDAALTASWEKS